MGVYRDWVQITISEEKREKLAGERDLRIIYVYEGKACLTLGGASVTLRKDDFYVINSGDSAEYRMERSGFVGIIRLKYSFAEEYLELKRFYIICSSLKEHGVSEERIGVYLRSIFSNGMNKDPASEALLLSDVYRLLYLMRENCRVKRKTIGDAEQEDEHRRVEFIRSYIQENYNERISLEDLSRETFFSVTYLSKYIKKNFGRNFSEVLQEQRLKHALVDLEETDQTITTIAMENGFASPIAFSKVFREKYSLTPSEYREKQALEKKRKEQNEKENAGFDPRLASIVKGRSHGEDLYTVNTRELKAKVSEARSFVRFWNRMINGGTAHDLMRADLQGHLLLLKNELGIEYVRMWDIYSPEMMLFNGNEERKYNFTRLDTVIDFLRKNQLRPYIELGPKPNILLRNTHEYLVAEKRERIADKPELYGDFVEQLARHYVRKYGAEEVEKWYFELWMETYSCDLEEYITVFDLLSKHLKSVSPNLRLGGIGESKETAIPMEEVVKAWSERNQKPDFFTFYSYPYEPVVEPLPYEKRTPDNSKRNLAANFVENNTGEHCAMLHENGFWDQEIHISEWNSSVSNRNLINDSVYKGTYVVRSLLAMLGKVQLAGYWFASDLFTEYYDTQHLLDGSGGLISKDGIRKPAFYGLSFFNRLEQYLLSVSEDAIITANARGSYSIVCHNYRHPEYYYYTVDEDKIKIDEYDRYFDNEQRTFHFLVSGVKNGTYQIKTRVVDSHHGSVQDEWRRMGLTDNLNEQDIEYLRRICVPHITIETLEVTDGTIDIQSVLEPNAIQHIHIYLLM